MLNQNDSPILQMLLQSLDQQKLKGQIAQGAQGATGQPQGQMPMTAPQSSQDGGNGPISQYLQGLINPTAQQLPWQNQGAGGQIDSALKSLASMFGG